MFADTLVMSTIGTWPTTETWMVASLMYVGTCSLIAFGLRLVERRLRIPR